MRRVVLFLFLFLAGVAACFVFLLLVVGVRGGFFVFFRHCLLNVCVPASTGAARSMHPLLHLLLSVPSSCLVACRRSVFCWFWLVG